VSTADDDLKLCKKKQEFKAERASAFLLTGGVRLIPFRRFAEKG
jgi:hypothetical protein